MAAIQMTKNQQTAVEASGCPLLVSAAAGSGKTAVLSERALRLLTKEHPVSADRLMIVTFTTAAAEEMRRRIADKLSDAVRSHPKDANLRRQQMLLARAQISTIHALCASLVRDHFAELGLPGEMRIGDTARLDILRKEAAEEVILSHYEAEDASFLSLVEYYCADRNDSILADLMLRLYTYIRSFAFPKAWLSDALSMYEADLRTSEWVKELCIGVCDSASYAVFLMKKALDEMAGSNLFEKYAPSFQDDLAYFESVYAAAEQNDLDAVAGLSSSHKKAKLAPARAPIDPDFADQMKTLRQEAYKAVDGQLALLFDAEESTFPLERHEKDRQILLPQIRTLFSLTEELYEKIDEKKRVENLLDFSDLEHFSVQLLARKTEKGIMPTPLALSLRETVDELMVDECQDISEVQDTIFRMLSKDEKNLFMVGDVKQSIYRFRQAMPELFISRRERYEPYPPKTDTGALILLEKNFRSRDVVCEMTNGIFSQIMKKHTAEIEYDESEYLVPGASYFEHPEAVCEVLIADGTEDDEGETVSSMEREADMIAKRIRALYESRYPVKDGDSTRPLRFGDIAVLMRSPRNTAEVFANAMRKAGIPCLSTANDAFFTAYEVAVVRAFLRAAENPLDDVSLVSVMLSPIGGFDADQVTAVRLLRKDAPLYTALFAAATEEENVRCKTLLERLDLIRQKSLSDGVHAAVLELYLRTELPKLVYAFGDGEKKEENLKQFLQIAKQFEEFSSGGLTGFLHYLDRAEESGVTFDGNKTLDAHIDSVRILSIHASKGLEFPICIVASCAKRFSDQDLKRDYQMNASLGFSMKTYVRSELRGYVSLPMAAVRSKNRRELVAEEMRLFYVALTRAKEKLIFSMCEKNAASKLSRAALMAVSACPHAYEVCRAKSYSDWIYSVLLRQPQNVFGDLQPSIFVPRTDKQLPVRVTIDSARGANEEEAQMRVSALPDDQMCALLKERIAFSYPDAVLPTLPVKVTATELSKQEADTIRLSERPRFLMDAGLTPAERGSALHAFMQFADYTAAASDLETEIARLCEKQYLTQAQCDALNRRAIGRFFSSKLYERMCHAQFLKREYSFIYEVSPELVAKEAHKIKEPIMLQGIADCVFKEEDGIVIVDYKTDYVTEESELRERYAMQLSIYKEAIAAQFSLPVKECLLYSLHLGRAIDVFLKK